jgi:hypothetical protein
MKRKELYKFVREEIINELTIVTKSTSSDEIPNIAKAEKVDTASVKKAVDAAKASGKDVNIAEMASYKFFRVADRAKFDALKDIYAGTVEERILNAIEAAGEQGITQANLAAEIGMASALINPILKKFGSVNAITLPVSEKPGKAEEPEVEEPEVEEPESEESDFFASDKEDKEDDEDMEPIDEPSEPSASDIAAAEKELDIVDTEKIEAANKAASVVKNLAVKIGGMKKGPEREKKMAALKQYIKNNRGTILKGFKISDLTNGLIS